MIVITLSVCPEKIRGDLTRWLFEIDTGVYCGNVSSRVRDNLWNRIIENIGSGRAAMAYTVHNEQHIKFRTLNSEWEPIDYDGLELLCHKKAMAKAGTESQIKGPVNAKTAEDNSCYVVLDFETTGLDVQSDKIIEIGALKVKNDDIVDTFQCLISPKVKLSQAIIELTGITDDLLEKDGNELKDCIEKLFQFIEGNTIVCHNADFDCLFLKKACMDCSIDFNLGPVNDTLKLARRKIKGIPNYKLKTIIEYLGIKKIQTHRALEDCYLTLEVYKKLKIF